MEIAFTTFLELLRAFFIKQLIQTNIAKKYNSKCAGQD